MFMEALSRKAKKAEKTQMPINSLMNKMKYILTTEYF
jgi:hypothetical protein